MTAPSSVATTNGQRQAAAGVQVDVAEELGTTATSAAAPPPAPLKMATICGMAVIGTRFAPSQPTTAPIAPPTTMIHQVETELPSRVKKVQTTTSAMPAAPSRLPVRAVFGLSEELQGQDEGDAGDEPDDVGDDLQRVSCTGDPRRGRLNISSMRSVTMKPPTTLIVPKTTATSEMTTRDRAVRGGGDEHGADHDHAVDCVRAAHERGVQHGRHLATRPRSRRRRRGRG